MSTCFFIISRLLRRAFPEQTEQDLAKARKFVAEVHDPSLHTLLTLACVSVLEEISYTRKDGQFLRWDPRSGRNVSERLHKSELPTLAQALQKRLSEIMNDIPELQRKYGGATPQLSSTGPVSLSSKSCLKRVLTLL